MKLIKILTILLIVTGLLSCVSNQNMRDISKYKIPVNDFSKTVELLISNQQFLEDEIMKDSWLLSEKFENLIFSVDYKSKWTDALLLIGIDPSKLTSYAGSS